MGFDLGRASEDWQPGDRSWIRQHFGLDQCMTITLDLTFFSDALVDDRGFIPSGTPVGEITSSGLYGSYLPADVLGRGVAKGLLLNDVLKTKAGRLKTRDVTALFWRGIVRFSRLPTFVGTAGGEGVLDANGRTDLRPNITFEDEF